MPRHPSPIGACECPCTSARSVTNAISRWTEVARATDHHAGGMGCGESMAQRQPIRHDIGMPRSVKLSAQLEGSAFRVDEADFHGLHGHRLRLVALDRPHRGVRSLGLDVSTTRGRCRAYLPILGTKVFSHTTAALLHGIPLPLAAQADPSLHVSSIGGTRPRGEGIAGHELVTATVALVEELPVIAAADTWCHLAASIDREQLVAAGDFLVSGTRLPGGGRTPPLCSAAELQAAVRRHGRRPGAPALRWALPRLRTGVDSVPETLVRLAIVAAGLAEPVIGHPIE